MRKVALVTGITGMDGSYAAELLLEKGYIVYGMVRQCVERSYKNLSKILDHQDFFIINGDLTENHSIQRAVKIVRPTIVLNYGALSFVGASWDQPEIYQDVNATGVIRLLEAIKEYCPECRFYQAGSSEQFGDVKESPQSEDTPFNPRSPYGASKVSAFWHTKIYRESYGLFAVTGIGFNHEGERRGSQFVTQKICEAAARIERGLQNSIELGNIDAKRDWGYSPDYVAANIAMLESDDPQDYVIATGELHSVKEWGEAAFRYFGLDFGAYWRHNPAYDRPADVHLLVGDASKIKENLGWEPKVTFRGLVEKMCKAAHDGIC
jgi:GDPmannose 4,6-dehydratase